MKKPTSGDSQVEVVSFDPWKWLNENANRKRKAQNMILSIISVIPNPELRRFWGDYLTKHDKNHDKPGNSASKRDLFGMVNFRDPFEWLLVTFN